MARYDIDPARSRVWIDASSSLHPIHTETDGLEGFVDLELDDDGGLDLTVAPKGQMLLPVDRLSSGNAFEDRELRRRIDSRRFPTIEGRLVELRRAGTDGQYRVRGELTFRGVTNSYEDDMTIAEVDEQTVGLEGRATFDIRDFGMEPPRILMLRVHPEVTVKVAIVATKEA